MASTELPLLPRGFRLEKGYVWPAHDFACAEALLHDPRAADDFEKVMEEVKDFRVCIQAGGNCGLWPLKLSGWFEVVYTAEPDPRNFVALSWNTAEALNVVKMQCAFGDNRALFKMVEPKTEPNNCGALHVAPGGFIPTVRIDDVEVASCGLIYLDVEGFELPALQGAERTVDRHRPIIAIEDKGMSERFGHPIGMCANWIVDRFKYKVIRRLERDVILGPK